MLSKKMTVSLTSLIIILALAFMVPSAMAGDFATTLTVGGHDVSHADGEQRTVGDVTLNVTFGQVVTFDDSAAAAIGTTLDATEEFKQSDFIVRAYDANGAVEDDGTAITAVIASGTAANGKDYTVTLAAIPADTMKLYVQIPQGSVGAADPTVADADDANAKAEVTIEFLVADGATDAAANNEAFGSADNGPDVLKIARVGEPFATITSAEFMVHVLLSEDAKAADPAVGGLTKDLIDVGDAATVNSVVKLASPAVGTMTVADAGLVARGESTDSPADPIHTTTTALSTLDTWRDGMLHLYLVTIGTMKGEKTVTVKVNNFAGMENPAPGSAQEMYNRAADSALVEGRDKLTVKTKTATDPAVAKASGFEFKLPIEEKQDDVAYNAMLPGSGFLVIARDKAGSGIDTAAVKEENDKTKRTPEQLKYNVRAGGLPNLENFLGSGGKIDLVSYDGTPAASAYISEVMWGSDASLDVPAKSQWIEIANRGSADISPAKDKWILWFYRHNESPPATYALADGTAGTLQDRIGTTDASGVYWANGTAGKGQSGASGVDRTVAAADAADVERTVALPPSAPIISMYRMMDAAGTPEDGQMSSSWMQSAQPSANFKLGIQGTFIGTPGAGPQSFTAATPPKEEEKPTPPVKAAMSDEITISEIMVDTADGRLPQWIELTYSGMDKASLEGWEMRIDNAIDAGVLGGGNIITISLSGVMVDVSTNPGNMGKGQSVLVAAWGAPRKSDNIRDARVINVGELLGQTGRYQLLSANGFKITLSPPQTGAIDVPGDRAGNLHEDWELPMSEGTARSSIIRYEMLVDGTMTKGTDANAWVLADSTDLAVGPQSYYGDDEDSSTPGQHAGGPLPVELSHFRPARDQQTGAVVITWATQSELNNAGFFIKRSQQRNGEFKVINATMIPGAGTTSEKQFYTYTDTTAQPNVVYYYQIEDVSLDGNRQTLTRGIRLKGHIGAAGKLTSTWGELKSSNE